MDMSEYVATLRRELATITRFASDDVARAAEMLTEALESPVRLTLLEVLSAAAAEITTRLRDAVIEVRLTGNGADFVVTETAHGLAAEPAEPAAADSSDDMTRVTLRLPEQLKTRVETSAATAGISVNAWLVRAVAQALEPPSGRPGRARPGAGRHVTGYARS
ncbi:MAG: histidine kinase [Streptosporangiaceae bacterium]